MALASPPGSENPSPAFLAGQAHGTQLAIQHHVAAATATPPASKPPAAPTKPTAQAPPVTLNSALAQAQAAAQQDTNQQVAALKAQQNLYNSQGAARAQQINAASQAAAQFLAGLGDNTGASYNNAAQVLAGLAQGYSGNVRDTASSAAQQIQQQLAGLGAPSGSAKTATGQTSQPAALANVLYGLGGAIPANLLVTSGQALAGAQRQLPAATLGLGQQQAAGTLAASQQNAANLIPQIVAAKAGQPKLVQSYFNSILSQLTNQSLAGSLIDSRTNSGQVAQQRANAYQQAVTNQGQVAQQRANTYAQSVTNAAKARAAGKPLSVASLAKLSQQAHDFYNGVPPQVHYVNGVAQPVPGTGSQPVHWATAVARLVAQGASQAKAIQILSAQGWQPGEGGRPYASAQQQFQATRSHPPAVGATVKDASGATYVWSGHGWVKK